MAVRLLPSPTGLGSAHATATFRAARRASPQQVAKSRRVQRAKRLIDETDEPLAQIAYRAGFVSVRRFNATFRELYGRSPSTIRRRAKVFT